VKNTFKNHKLCVVQQEYVVAKNVVVVRTIGAELVVIFSRYIMKWTAGRKRGSESNIRWSIKEDIMEE